LKKLIELRDANAVELDTLVTEMEEMESGEELDAKLERSNALVSENK